MEVESLMCELSSSDVTVRTASETPHVSCLVSYRSLSSRFIFRVQQFSQQYSQLYFSRLEILEPLVRRSAAKEWSPEVSVLGNVKDAAEGEDTVLVGTLYKAMRLKPTVMRDYIQELALVEETCKNSGCWSDPDSDYLYIEDRESRCELVLANKDSIGQYVTGIVCAVRGRKLKGKFEVVDFCLAGIPSINDFSAATNKNSGKSYLAFVSGLRFGSGHPVKIDLLLQFLLGATSSKTLASQIVRVVIAGNALFDCNKGINREAMEEADLFMSELSTVTHVDLMPGSDDPSNYSLPQQPLHPFLFPRARRFSSFQSVSNPYDFEIDGVRVLGTSGQNVEDFKKFSEVTSTVEVLEIMLASRCIAPTCPDTLACYPFVGQDPFCLVEDDTGPRIFFAGGQLKVEYKDGTDSKVTCLCLGVPDFQLEPTLVLVDLATLQVETVLFG